MNFLQHIRCGLLGHGPWRHGSWISSSGEEPQLCSICLRCGEIVMDVGQVAHRKIQDEDAYDGPIDYIDTNTKAKTSNAN